MADQYQPPTAKSLLFGVIPHPQTSAHDEKLADTFTEIETAYHSIEADGKRRRARGASCLSVWAPGVTAGLLLFVGAGTLAWTSRTSSRGSSVVLPLATTARDSGSSGSSGFTHSLAKAMTELVAPAPYKMLLDGLTPPRDQMARGDCWLFAITGVLEDSYRRYGVERGWMPSDQYVRLSRQAFGIRVMKECETKPSFMCPASIDDDGTTIHWGGTTQGADERMIAFFTSLSNAAIPDSVCAYTNTSDDELMCDGLDAARATNPLHFTVKRAQFFHEDVDIKRALHSGGRVLSLGLPMIINEYFVPCTEKTAKAYKCDPHDEEKCVPCPMHRVYAGASCCVALRRPMVSMRGEWHHRPGGKMELMGGHAINIVGYTDTYTDEWGNRGGFIIRNSWSDGLGNAHGSVGRGSHSANYFMRAVHEYDEALACPNPHSPRSWYKCMSLEACNGTLTALWAQRLRQPLELTCIDNSLSVGEVCEKGASYYLANITEWDGDGLFVGCFIPADGGKLLCAPPLLIDDLAQLFTPVSIEYVNEPDLCQYNFIPYATLEAIRSRFGKGVATDFAIEWSRSSYASQHAIAETKDNATKGMTLDYSLIKNSTYDLPDYGRRAGAMWV